MQAAMGWTNSHLHEFGIAGKRYGMPDNEWPEDKLVLDDRRSHVGAVLGEGVRASCSQRGQYLADLPCWPECMFP